MNEKIERKVISQCFTVLLKEEVRGRRFFADAAKFVDALEAKKTLEWLATEENFHVDILNKLRQDWESDQEKNRVAETGAHVKELYAGEEITVYQYSVKDVTEMQEVSLPQLELFKADRFSELLKGASIQDIFKLAMQIEYQNFKYIMDLVKVLKIRTFHDVLLKLAEEEKKHFILLRSKYDRLVKPGTKQNR